MRPLLEGDVSGCVAYEHEREEQAGAGDERRPRPDQRSRRDRRRECAGGKGRCGDAEVARRLVQPQRESPSSWAGEVDLHQHRHRPGEALVGAEQEVGRDDPAPARRQPDQERHRQRKRPAEHEQALPSRALCERPCGQVGERLGGAEGDDEGQDRRLRGEPEVTLADERKHAALQPDHRPDEGIEGDEQRELRRIRPQAEANGGAAHRRAAVAPRLFAATISA